MQAVSFPPRMIPLKFLLIKPSRGNAFKINSHEKLPGCRCCFFAFLHVKHKIKSPAIDCRSSSCLSAYFISLVPTRRHPAFPRNLPHSIARRWEKRKRKIFTTTSRRRKPTCIRMGGRVANKPLIIPIQANPGTTRSER